MTRPSPYRTPTPFGKTLAVAESGDMVSLTYATLIVSAVYGCDREGQPRVFLGSLKTVQVDGRAARAA
jgi:hypothetical protein